MRTIIDYLLIPERQSTFAGVEYIMVPVASNFNTIVLVACPKATVPLYC